MTSKQAALFNFLRSQRLGTLLSEQALMTAMHWKPSTLRTYEAKNFLSPFLRREGSSFRVLKGGTDLAEKDVLERFTQVKSKPLILVEGMVLTGASGTAYRLVRSLGSGAVGHVWQASAESGGQAAVKVLMPREDLLDPTHFSNVRDRFRREAKNGACLSAGCDYLIKYLDQGDTPGGTPFIVMELARESLAHRLEGGALAPADARAIVARVLRARSFIHQQQCCHRDVKPANVLLTSLGWVLGDLGIVKWSDLNPAFTAAATVTRGSVQLGSWYYMAPEQRQDPHEAVPRSDLFALGMSWYEMLTAKVLEPMQVGAGRFPKPSAEAETNTLLARMLEYDPELRPSAAEALKALGE
jgi:serine/threonine protein kinase